LSAPNGASASRLVRWEVRCVFLEGVVRRQVHAAAEPADRLAARGRGHEHAHVHVHGGHVRVARVEHERHAHRLERRAGQFRAVLRGRWWQRLALHVREAAAAALDHRTAFEQAREAIAFEPDAGPPQGGRSPSGGRRRRRLGGQHLSTRFALPRVGDEGMAILGLDRVDDAALQIEQVRANRR